MSNKVPWLSSASEPPLDFLDRFWDDFRAEGCLDLAFLAAYKKKQYTNKYINTCKQMLKLFYQLIPVQLYILYM